MQLTVFILTYPLLWCISRLPFRILYWFSDAIYILLYHVIRYRKKVVRHNLALVFPEKDTEERLQIEKKFYKHLCDMFLEMIKTMGISEKVLQKRFVFTNIEVLRQLEAKNKSVMLMFPHYASWEWVIALNKHLNSQGYGIYQKIANRYFDTLVRAIRQKFGTTLITTKATKELIIRNAERGILSTYGILSDQSPQLKKTLLWTSFMGIVVPAHAGAEMLCRKLDLPAVYLKVDKLRRGYYRGTFDLITEKPKELQEFELTQSFLKRVENAIREAPEYYFWTHNRWKHRNKIPQSLKGSTKESADVAST